MVCPAKCLVRTIAKPSGQHNVPGIILISINELDERTGTKRVPEELVQMTRNYSPNSTKIALVIPKTRSDDLQWLQEYLRTQYVNSSLPSLSAANHCLRLRNNTTPFIFSMSRRRETELLIPHSTRGREVAAYLSYVIDYYDQLPSYSIFIHAGEEQRHNDLFGPRTRTVLENLRLEAVDAKGYVNLRCQHSPGCPSHVHPNHPTETDIKNRDTRAYFAQIYKDLFGPDAKVPDVIGGVCCAQFAVSRDQIRRRPKRDYIRMMEWVDQGSKEIVDSYGVGWAFEVVWHVVFSMEDV